VKAKVFSHKHLIGTVDLQVGDGSMGCVFGEFLPNENYYNDIQKSVWKFWGQDRDYQKWYDLRFNVQLDNGYFLYAAGGFTFEDIPEFQDEPKRIDIAGIDGHVINDFFLQETPRSFVVEPWSEITIEQKLALEDELRRELGVDYKSALRLDSIHPKSEGDVLTGFEISALCKDQRNDDVLFVTGKGFEKLFTVVHLTWSGRVESKGYPLTEMYDTFDDFRQSRMYADKADWES
jgi:hypothetical protein